MLPTENRWWSAAVSPANAVFVDAVVMFSVLLLPVSQYEFWMMRPACIWGGLDKACGRYGLSCCAGLSGEASTGKPRAAIIDSAERLPTQRSITQSLSVMRGTFKSSLLAKSAHFNLCFPVANPFDVRLTPFLINATSFHWFFNCCFICAYIISFCAYTPYLWGEKNTPSK